MRAAPGPRGNACYDRIAREWEAATGDQGGPFKRFVLNDRLLDLIPDVSGKCLLELGAGNGYFAHWLSRRRKGQAPARRIVSDVSAVLLDLAQRRRRVRGAEYLLLDARGPYPLEPSTVDLILATMVFNEMPDVSLRSALGECRRVLKGDGVLLATVAHPRFVASLERRDQLRAAGHRGRLMTMPGPGRLRLPVVPRSAEEYEGMLAKAGFRFEPFDVSADERVLEKKPGLRNVGGLPLARIYRCGPTLRVADPPP